MDSLEGAVAEISCNHSISDVYDFLWYLYFPGFAPRLLIKGSKPSQQGRYNMTYERFSSSLLILQVQPADAGVYYCALRCTEAGPPWRAEQKQGEVRAFAGCGRKTNNNCFPACSQFSIPQAFPFALSGKTFESKHYIQWASLVAHLVMSLQCRRPRFDSWVGKIPWRRVRVPIPVFLGFPGGSDGKESPCNAGDLCSVPGLVRFPGAEYQYSHLENPHGARRLEGYSAWGRKELDMTEKISTAQHSTVYTKST